MELPQSAPIGTPDPSRQGVASSPQDSVLMNAIHDTMTMGNETTRTACGLKLDTLKVLSGELRSVRNRRAEVTCPECIAFLAKLGVPAGWV